MRLRTFTLSLLYGSVGLFIVSCQQEIAEIATDPKLKMQSTSFATVEEALLAIDLKAFPHFQTNCAFDVLGKDLQALNTASAIAPSACTITEMDKTIGAYTQQFGPLESRFYSSYKAVNRVATIMDADSQYFGASGEHTTLVAKHKIALENFWDMHNQIRVKGLHNSTLANRDKIAGVYLVTGYPASLAYAVADQLLLINQMSPVFVETPLLSFDAFATTTKIIVLGDGLVQMLAESGIQEEVSVAGVLAHEWGHQVQFNNFKPWFGMEKENFVRSPETSRLVELEADFFTGYYLTNKKGGTQNWKNTAGFFDLFFNLGDCSFASASHHGTPNQRLAASRLGYLVALITSRGKNLSPDEIHTLFMAVHNSIIENNINPAQVLVGLKNKQLQNIFAGILLYKNQVKDIRDGKMNKSQIQNLQD